MLHLQQTRRSNPQWLFVAVKSHALGACTSLDAASLSLSLQVLLLYNPTLGRHTFGDVWPMSSIDHVTCTGQPATTGTKETTTPPSSTKISASYARLKERRGLRQYERAPRGQITPRPSTFCSAHPTGDVYGTVTTVWRHESWVSSGIEQ